MRMMAAFVIALVALVALRAEQGTGDRSVDGTITGRVNVVADGTTQPVPWVSVAAISADRMLGVTSGSDGKYRLAVPAGRYDLWFSAYGFTPAAIEHLDVAAGAEVQRDVTLASTTPTVTMPRIPNTDATIDVRAEDPAQGLGGIRAFGPREAPRLLFELSNGVVNVAETIPLVPNRPTPIRSDTYTLWANIRSLGAAQPSPKPIVTAVQNVVILPGETKTVNVPAVVPVPDVRVRIDTTAGAIDLVVEPSAAPITAANFLKYVDGGFCTNGRFHRATREGNYAVALPNRPLLECIQAGINPDRKSDGFPPIPLEPTTVTGLTHVVGTVAMARGAHSDTATSDFFILLNDQPSLDLGGRRFDDWQGSAAFGHVVAGMDVVRKIQQLPTTGQSLTPPVTIRSATRVR